MNDKVAAAVELKACPFCGEGNSIVSLWFDDVVKRWRVGCGRCGCSTGTSPRDKTEAPAIAAWNTRTPALGELSDTVLFNLYAEMNAVYVLSGKIPSAAQVAKAAREFLEKVDA